MTGQPALLGDDLQPSRAALPPRRKRTVRRTLTPLEKAAQINAGELLNDIIRRAPAWTYDEVKKAAVAAAREHATISANELRAWLPEEAHINVGAAVRALSNMGVLVDTGQEVPSDLHSTHGKPLTVYRLCTSADAGREVSA